MDLKNKKNAKMFKIAIIIAIAVLILATVGILTIKYNVDGDKNMPFKISSIKIISTAQGINQEDAENRWNMKVLAKNDFYFYIEKNPKYSKEDSISKVIFENFKITKNSEIGDIEIYKPSTNSILYTYTDEYKLNNSVIYNGAISTNITSMEIGNQGGSIGFSVVLNNLGDYITNEDTEIIHNGTLISKLNLSTEDVKMKVSFDVIIETSKNKKYKSTLEFEVPSADIIENGISTIEKNNSDEFIFKRF